MSASVPPGGAVHAGLPQAPCRILVIDDSPVDRAIVADLIELHGGCEAVAVATAAEAEAELKRGDVSALIVDHNLDQERGIDLVAGWRNRGFKIPMILMTSAPTQDLECRAAMAGATATVAKGAMEPDALVELLTRFSAV